MKKEKFTKENSSIESYNLTQTTGLMQQELNVGEINKIEQIEEDILSIDLKENQTLPKKIKIDGTIYYRKKKTFEENKTLTNIDKKLLTKASKIKYSPPLSYRWLKIFGLFALILPFLMVRIAASFPNMSNTLISAVSDVANALCLPLIIFAAFTIILKSKEKGKLIITYAIIALGIYILLVFLFERYFISILANLNPDLTAAEVRTLANNIAVSMKIFNYNIFIDLFLCATFFYFTNATPKKIAKSNKKMLAFRLCALIPVIYVIVSMILSGLLHSKVITLNVETVGLLTCRSPATYLIFFSLSLFISFSQRFYIKKGGSVQGFEEYKKTNAHSLMFSIACSIVILVVCLLDFLFGLIPGSNSFGIGESSLMFVVIPFIMLISYTKEHKNNTIDLFLPIISIVTIVFLIIDTVFTYLV